MCVIKKHCFSDSTKVNLNQETEYVLKNLTSVSLMKGNVRVLNFVCRCVCAYTFVYIWVHTQDGAFKEHVHFFFLP